MNLQQAHDVLVQAFPLCDVQVSASLETVVVRYGADKGTRKAPTCQFTVYIWDGAKSIRETSPSLTGLVDAMLAKLRPMENASDAAECLTDPKPRIPHNPTSATYIGNGVKNRPVDGNGATLPDDRPEVIHIKPGDPSLLKQQLEGSVALLPDAQRDRQTLDVTG